MMKKLTDNISINPNKHNFIYSFSYGEIVSN